MPNPLGRLTPPNFDHVSAKPLKDLEAAPTDIPVVIGINWYTAFDTPIEKTSEEEGVSWHLPDVSKQESLGSVRGGHCVCLEPMKIVKTETENLWRFYNQQSEGACVGFGHARQQTILKGINTHLYDALKLYDDARRQEGTYPSGEGTTCAAAASAMEKVGVAQQSGNALCEREVGDGPTEIAIKGVYWATSVEEVLAALARSGAEAVPLANSWGMSYPKHVWLPTATLERLLKEEGEADIVVEVAPVADPVAAEPTP